MLPVYVCLQQFLKASKTIDDFPNIPETSKSLLKKYLTKDVYNKLKNAKDANGFTLQQLISSGLVNPDSSIGVYAGSTDSYKVFAPLLNKIISDYHNYDVNSKHISSWDISSYNFEDFNSKHKGDYVVSTRVRIARNLAKFPLGTNVTKEQRQEIENLAIQAFNSFEGELKGTYYPLGKLTEQEKKQLKEDHFLFKEGDRFLKACGCERDWPDARGIFINPSKTFLVWVNEEDQFRIISMQNGGDLKQVFERLAKAHEIINKIAQFSITENFGAITTCPTNLGTGMRASVHVKLPLLSNDEKRFKQIAAKHHLDIRGIDGEHSESKGGIFDVSNKRRLGYSEAQLALDMYNGVNELIEVEKSLQAEVYPTFPQSSNSLLKKYLSRELFDELKHVQDNTGYTLQQLIASGIANPDSSIGVYAGSTDSYQVFAPLLDKIIQDYHNYGVSGKHTMSWDINAYNFEDFNIKHGSDFVISTRVRIARNLAKLPLGTNISREQRREVERLAVQAFDSFEGELKGTYYQLGKLTAAEKKQLKEDHFLFKEGDRFLKSCGCERDWPESRGIFHNPQKTFLVWVNEEDQFRIISMQNGGNLRQVFERLATAHEIINKVAEFAITDHLGAITTCPTNLGTGMRASVHVKLPLLSSDEKIFKSIAELHNLDIRGIDGEHSESKGGVFDVSNKRRLGYSEAQLALDMYNGVNALIEVEKSLQQQIKS